MSWPLNACATDNGSGFTPGRLTVSDEPSAAPLSVDEAKLFLKVDSDDEDDLIEGLIAAARNIFETLTGRTCVETGYVCAWDRWPRVGTYIGAGYTREIELPRTPLIELTKLSYLDENGDEVEIDADDYRAEEGGDPRQYPRVVLNSDVSIPALGIFPGALRAEFAAGAADAAAVPAEIKAALRLLVVHLYENRSPVVIGSIINEVPFALKALIEMHQVRTIA